MRFLKYKFLFKKFLLPTNKESKTVGLLGIFGVFIGVFALVFVISIMKGFEKRLVNRIVGNEPHLIVSDKIDAVIDSEILEDIKNLNIKEIKASSLFIETETVFYIGKTTSGGIIFSANPLFLKEILGIDYELKEGEAFIGKELGLRNDLYVDDSFDALSVWELIKKSSLPKLASFKVKGQIRVGDFQKDSTYIYVNIEDALKFFSPIPDMASSIAILLNDPMSVEFVSKKILDSIPNIKVETWKTRNKTILFSLKMERFLMFAMLLFVLLLASFAVMGSIVLDLESRKRDFALLVSLGLKKNTLRRLILGIAFFRSFIGGLLGGVFSGIFCLLLQKYHFIHLPIIYYDPTLPINFSWLLVLEVILLALFLGLLGTIFAVRDLKLPLISRIQK